MNDELERSHGKQFDKVRPNKHLAALSDVFVDNAIGYTSIAKRVEGYEHFAIATAFFIDAAPACYSNLQAPFHPSRQHSTPPGLLK